MGGIEAAGSPKAATSLAPSTQDNAQPTVGHPRSTSEKIPRSQHISTDSLQPQFSSGSSGGPFISLKLQACRRG